MQAVRRRDTDGEVALRTILHRKGFRYRIDCSPLLGLRARADLVFTKARVAVFVDGCFWHGCPVHATWPKANANWWKSKILSNMDRDARVNRTLEDAGWIVVRVWAHEPPARAACRVQRLLARRLRPSGLSSKR